MAGLYSTARWQRLRRAQLQREPLCRMCEQQGKTTAATVADHIERHNGDPDKFFNGALQSLCKTHHDSTKQRQEKSGRVQGCDALGIPLDGAHHWRKA